MRLAAVPFCVTTGDFNSDGITDLATANFSSHNVSVLLGVGDGTFAAQATYTVGHDPNSVTTGDFNGDGVTDLVIANGVSDNVSVLLNQSGGGFATIVPDGTHRVPRFSNWWRRWRMSLNQMIRGCVSIRDSRSIPAKLPFG